MTERNEHKNEKYQDGDIYLNPCFGDLWVVDGTSFIKINNGYAIDLDEPEGFIKVGHIDGVIRIEQGLLVGYCSWDGDKLIPADGDYYSVDEVISKYEYEENGSLTYWTVSEWM